MCGLICFAVGGAREVRFCFAGTYARGQREIARDGVGTCFWKIGGRGLGPR